MAGEELCSDHPSISSFGFQPIKASTIAETLSDRNVGCRPRHIWRKIFPAQLGMLAADRIS